MEPLYTTRACNLIEAAESYKARNGRYPARILADQIYRNRANLRFCKEHGIRMSGPKLGRPQPESDDERKQSYQDNTDRIEVERNFSLCKRCFGLGLITAKLEETVTGAIGLSVFAMNLFKLLRRNVLPFCAFLRMALLELFGGDLCASSPLRHPQSVLICA